ncbi:MAG: hypothetical protein ACR2PG_08160 [Hyphomicrobiaceae bacterium]
MYERPRLKRASCVSVSILAGVLLLQPSTSVLNAEQSIEAGLAAFSAMASVMQHPRCLNCHRATEPSTRDDSRRHIPRVRPGRDGFGSGGEQCSICHRESNNDRTRIPGAIGWRSPPYSMSWDGLDQGDICDNIKDQAMNGQRSLDDLKYHFEEDILVKWAWAPGARRTPPPISYESFLTHIHTWLRSGAPCPPIPGD